MKLATLALTAALVAAPAYGETAMNTTQDHAHDFDFLVGKWKVHHWRLKDRLMNSHDWVEFDGTSEMKMTLNGHGTFDENFLDLPGDPYYAVGLRGFDTKTQTWSIWWLDGRNPVPPIDPPVRGNFDFHDGVGTFEGDDVLRGKPIRVRYTWSKITKTTAHWEQAFSPDGGKSWEVNWRMDFTRVP